MDRLVLFMRNTNTFIKYFKKIFETIFTENFVVECSWRKYLNNVAFCESNLFQVLFGKIKCISCSYKYFFFTNYFLNFTKSFIFFKNLVKNHF